VTDDSLSEVTGEGQSGSEKKVDLPKLKSALEIEIKKQVRNWNLLKTFFRLHEMPYQNLLGTVKWTLEWKRFQQ